MTPLPYTPLIPTGPAVRRCPGLGAAAGIGCAFGGRQIQAASRDAQTVDHRPPRCGALQRPSTAQAGQYPCESSEVRQLLAKGRRAAHKRGERPSKKTAITATEMMAMTATCGEDLVGKRDRALLYFAFANGGAPSERSGPCHLEQACTDRRRLPLPPGCRQNAAGRGQSWWFAGQALVGSIGRSVSRLDRSGRTAGGLQEDARFRQLTPGKVVAGCPPSR